MNIAFVTASLILATLQSSQDPTFPVELEPNHKTVLKNEYIQVFRVTLDPGKSTFMHTHSHDDAAIRLSAATIAADGPGQPMGAPESFIPGFVTARDNEAKPLTHRVHNIGTTVFDVLDVQVLARPAGPTVDAIIPPAVENAKMRVYRYELEPGGATAQHAHARPYLLVAATDMNLRMTSPDGASMEHFVKAGDMHWVDSAVTHSLANAGTTRAILIEVELK